MKYIFTLLFVGLVAYGFAQNQNDKLLLEAKVALDKNDYEASLKALNRVTRNKNTNELVQYFMVQNYFGLLHEEQYPSFSLISKTRDLASSFISNYPKSSRIKEIQDINREMKDFPKTEEEYMFKKAEDEERKRIAKQKKLLDEIVMLYQKKDFEGSLRAIKASRDAGYNDEHVKYYEVLIKNQQLNGLPMQTYQAIEEVRNLALVLINNDQKNLSETESKELERIYDTLPKSLNAFQQQQEEKRIERENQERQRKFEAIARDFQRENFYKVVNIYNDFPDGSKEKMQVDYFQGMSQYLLLKKSYEYSFEDLSSARSSLNFFLKKYDNQDFTLKTVVTDAVTDLERNYPRNQYSYTQMQNKKKREQERQVVRSRRTKFVSIGYEYGKLAPYGMRFELGGKSVVGFFTVLRYGLKSESQINDYYSMHKESEPNKSEILVGPNFRLTNWLFFNVGAGYGIYSHFYRNDYANDSGYKTSGYFAGYSGVTLRAGEAINFVGGVSSMAIDKQISDKKFIRPEFTVGITFNLK